VPADGYGPSLRIRMAPPTESRHIAAMRVLVVDDSERLRQTLAAGLRTKGVSVETAANGLTR
jgi:response regulator RpfG family c-di-GMP phosphodiesterase